MQLPDAEWAALSGDPAARRAALLLALARDRRGSGRGRRVGGLHRRKKKTVASIYGFHGLRTIEDLQSLLEKAAVETMALENTIARNRTIGGFISVGAKLIEVGDLEARLALLEVALESARETGAADPADGGLLGG